MNNITDLNQVHNIVRYPNRKLYDTTLSRYINLTSSNEMELTVETLLRNHIPIQVTDNATGNDITARTISSVINGLLKTNPNLSTQVFNFIDNLTNGTNHEITNI